MAHFYLKSPGCLSQSYPLCVCSLQRGGGHHVDDWAHLADDGHSESPRPPADGQVGTAGSGAPAVVTLPPCGRRAELLTELSAADLGRFLNPT